MKTLADKCLSQITVKVIEKKLNRELALEWWNKLDLYKQIDLVFKYFKGRSIKSLTGREIEQIWLNKTQQSIPERGIKITKINEPKVDFELLNKTYKAVISNSNMHKDTQNNMLLFFDLLSQKQSFAVLAHKMLKNLNK